MLVRAFSLEFLSTTLLSESYCRWCVVSQGPHGDLYDSSTEPMNIHEELTHAKTHWPKARFRLDPGNLRDGQTVLNLLEENRAQNGQRACYLCVKHGGGAKQEPRTYLDDTTEFSSASMGAIELSNLLVEGEIRT